MVADLHFGSKFAAMSSPESKQQWQVYKFEKVLKYTGIRSFRKTALTAVY